MTNLEIAQEQITKEKEEKRIELIKDALIRKEKLQEEIKKLDEEIASLENKEITLDNEDHPISTTFGTFYTDKS